MRSTDPMRRRLHLVVVTIIAVGGALGLATMAGAQNQRKPQPPVLVGGKLMQPPDMGQFDQYMERGPDGQKRLKPGAAAKIKVPLIGSDGKVMKNPDGSTKMVSLDNPDGDRPLEPDSRESEAMDAKARAKGNASGSEGITAEGDRQSRSFLPPIQMGQAR